jgi:hypothetical protein
LNEEVTSVEEPKQKPKTPVKIAKQHHSFKRWLAATMKRRALKPKAKSLDG